MKKYLFIGIVIGVVITSSVFVFLPTNKNTECSTRMAEEYKEMGDMLGYIRGVSDIANVALKYTEGENCINYTNFASETIRLTKEYQNELDQMVENHQ